MKDESQTDVAAEQASHLNNALQRHLGDVVGCLERESSFSSGRLKVRLTRVVNFLRQNPNLDQVLQHRDALALLLPIFNAATPDDSAARLDADPLTRGKVEIAVRSGVQRISETSVYRRNWLQLFWYPALVLIVAFFVSVILSFTVALEFEGLLQNLFGGNQNIQLFTVRTPWLTQLVLAIASFLRLAWATITFLSCVAIFVAAWANYRQRRQSESGLGWWDDQNISVRGALAIWSDHLSSLLKVGVSQTEAFEIVSRESPKMSLRKLSSALADRDKAVASDAVKPYFPLRKYALLDHALNQNSLPAKTTALDEVAFYYRHRDQFVSTWWMSWGSTAMLWLTGLAVLGLFLAIFLPFYSFIRGLTGAVSGLGN